MVLERLKWNAKKRDMPGVASMPSSAQPDIPHATRPGVCPTMNAKRGPQLTSLPEHTPNFYSGFSFFLFFFLFIEEEHVRILQRQYQNSSSRRYITSNILSSISSSPPLLSTCKSLRGGSASSARLTVTLTWTGIEDASPFTTIAHDYRSTPCY